MRQVYQNNEIIDETIVRGESTMMGSAMRLNLQTLPFISGEHVYKVRSHGNVWNSETCRFDKPVISDWSDEIRNTFLIDDEW
ncbi:MAG: hypothetical protein FWE84_00610 [Firmicutes bacterium]|nr:hypothetical protein [Bacillota bacterium]